MMLLLVYMLYVTLDYFYGNKIKIFFMNLNQKIVTNLKRKKLKISFAESCTGGLLSSTITSVSGSSKIFSMGLVTYSNQSKTNCIKNS